LTQKRFSTALRDHVRAKIEQLGKADIVIGIPSFFCDNTIAHVLEVVTKGIQKHYPDYKTLLIVSDGGSTDDTREIALLFDEKSYGIEKVVTIYRGLPGKGSALRAILEVADFLQPKALAVFDSDLLSISPEWIKNIIDPVLSGHDLVAPDYQRYKFDATITNTIAYNLTRALYAVRIRQPIGGDFGLSLKLCKYYIDHHDVWETDVARFGIDIWMTTMAIVGGFSICQAKLGVKVHGQKDPSGDLGPMFSQVVGTIFQLMEEHVDFWKNIKGSKDIISIGDYPNQEPEPFDINQNNLIDYFKMGYRNFKGIWSELLEKEDFEVIKKLSQNGPKKRFYLPSEVWVRIVYRYAKRFHSTPRQRMKVLSTMIPLYYGRVGSLVNELTDKNAEDAEAVFNTHAEVFETMKDYLINIWE
jgi:glucosylglycerate synthase